MIKKQFLSFIRKVIRIGFVTILLFQHLEVVAAGNVFRSDKSCLVNDKTLLFEKMLSISPEELSKKDFFNELTEHVIDQVLPRRSIGSRGQIPEKKFWLTFDKWWKIDISSGFLEKTPLGLESWGDRLFYVIDFSQGDSPMRFIVEWLGQRVIPSESEARGVIKKNVFRTISVQMDGHLAFCHWEYLNRQ